MVCKIGNIKELGKNIQNSPRYLKHYLHTAGIRRTIIIQSINIDNAIES